MVLIRVICAFVAFTINAFGGAAAVAVSFTATVRHTPAALAPCKFWRTFAVVPIAIFVSAAFVSRVNTAALFAAVRFRARPIRAAASLPTLAINACFIFNAFTAVLAADHAFAAIFTKDQTEVARRAICIGLAGLFRDAVVSTQPAGWFACLFVFLNAPVFIFGLVAD